MITEWQPIMPDDKLKLKSRTIYEFLRGNLTTFLIVGRGEDQIADAAVFVRDEDVVGYREFECRPTPVGEPMRYEQKHGGRKS